MFFNQPEEIKKTHYFVVNSSDKSGNSNQSAQLNSTTATQAAASNASVEVTQTPPDGRTPPVISATEETRTTAPAADVGAGARLPVRMYHAT